ncbi:SDR family oxidoreductase [Herbaspirillum sp. alder98]|uniref:SDR family oxidoreductase n=1 Tax=Herbaspirillum sp. alder98 TaxID=2913096 RepID=UPI001CD856F0|nr:SDR family oxidoreductase [Herbaspirillum sp. alder98]MCA1323732.1 SDR family oxidoreductase [Herbaspirillum sp. alder98]
MKNSTVVVIGGLSGIGRAVAEQAAAAGARVIAAGRRQASANFPASITTTQVDIGNDASVAALFDSIGPFDHLVVTAGPVIASARLSDLNIDDAIAAFNIKFFGQMRVAQRALGSINRAGSITLTSGLLARKAVPGGLIKASMNAATEIMAKTLAKELAPLRVNVISPGMVESGMWGDMSEADRRAMAARVGPGLPVGRVGQGSDLAQAYLMLMQNGFMTGSVVDVDGGGLL